MDHLGHKVTRDQKENLDKGGSQENLVNQEPPVLKATRGQQDHLDQADRLVRLDLLGLPEQRALLDQVEFQYVNHMFLRESEYPTLLCV